MKRNNDYESRVYASVRIRILRHDYRILIKQVENREKVQVLIETMNSIDKLRTVGYSHLSSLLFNNERKRSKRL